MGKLRIILGGANLGTHYGIKDKENSKFQSHELPQLKKKLVEFGIKEIDSSSDYVNSLKHIGENFSDCNIISAYTKYSLNSYSTIENFEINFLQTKIDLKEVSIAGITLRDFAQAKLNVREKILARLKDLKDKGEIEKFGITIYGIDEIENCMDEIGNFDYIQVPENIVDRRLIKNKIINDLHDKGIEFHVRSIFLQGLLLMNNLEVPKKMIKDCSFLFELEKISLELERSVYQLAIDYCVTIPWSSALVVGVRSIEELQAFYIGLQKAKAINYEAFPRASSRISDPRKWKV